MFSRSFADPFSQDAALPRAWAFLELPASHAGTLLAQVALVRGGVFEASNDGGATIDGRGMVGPAGKVYAFASLESAESWRVIAESRARREMELACAMDAGRRAAWLAKKRARLASDAARRIDRAAQIVDGGIKAAVIADAGFALSKWAHYASG